MRGATVDFYHEGNLVFWIDYELEMIQSISCNGTVTGTKVSWLELYFFSEVKVA
jgi:hypothetical protein